MLYLSGSVGADNATAMFFSGSESAIDLTPIDPDEVLWRFWGPESWFPANNETGQGIGFIDRETIAGDFLSSLVELVIKMAKEARGVPALVAEIVEKYKALPEVKDVLVKAGPGRTKAVFTVLTWTAQLGRELMQKLISIETEADMLAWDRGYSFEYVYLPAPLVDLKTIGGDSLESLLW